MKLKVCAHEISLLRNRFMLIAFQKTSGVIYSHPGDMGNNSTH